MSSLRLEFVQITRGALPRTILALFVALTAYGLWAGVSERARWTDVVAANRAQAEEANAREQENIRLSRQEGFSPPGAPSAQLMDASLPPAPGVILAQGDAPLRPVTAWISLFARSDTLFRNTETESPLAASLGVMDLSWIVIVLMPLLVIALNHDLLSGDRDAARLGLLRAQAGSLGRVVVHRLGLRFLLPGVFVTAAAILAMALGTAAFVAFAWWLIATLYLAVWSLLAGWIGVCAQAARSAASILLLAWLGFVVVLPAAIALGIDWLSATQSRVAQVVATREVQLDLQERMSELLDRYLVDHPELVGADAGGFARSYFVAQRETESQVAPVMEKFAEAQRRRARWHTRLAWLSPATLAYGGMTRVAGTDSTRHDAFVAQAQAFAGTWRDHLREHLFLGRTLTPDEAASLPRFTFEEPRGIGQVSRLAGFLALLGVMLAVLLRGEIMDDELR